MILLLQSRQGSLLAATNSICLPLRVSSRWISREELRSILIDSSNEQCNSIRSSHWLPLTALVSLTEVDGQIGDGLSDWLDSHWLIEVECVILGLHSGVVDQDASIADDTAHGTCTVVVNLHQLLTLGLVDHQLG